MEQKTVLVVENREYLQEMNAAIFSQEHYTVDKASTKEEALQKLKQAEWDVVVFHMALRNGIDGIDLMDTYKGSQEYANAKKQPVFIAICDDEEQADKIRTRVDAVFTMGSFTPGDVLDQTQACFQRRQELQTTPLA